MPKKPECSKVRVVSEASPAITAAEFAEIKAAIPVDCEAESSEAGGEIRIHRNGTIKITGCSGKPVVLTDLAGLLLQTAWAADLPSRAIRPHFTWPAYRLIIAEHEEFARSVASENPEVGHIWAVPEICRPARLADNLIRHTYWRSLLPWCIECVFEGSEGTWARPLAEAAFIGIRTQPHPSIRLLDESEILSMLESAGHIARADSYPRIGIAINHYNRPAMAALAIWAAVSQNYPGEIVVAVVDDGSDEHSRALLEEFIKQLPNQCIRYVPLAYNTGVAASWNIAMRMLDDCPLITYTSSDNLQLLGQCYHLARWIALTGKPCTVSEVVYFGEKSCIMRLGQHSVQAALKGHGLGPSFLLEADYMHASGYMRPDFLYVEDTLCTAAMLLRGLEVADYHMPLYYYRWGSKDSLTHKVIRDFGGWARLLERHSQRLREIGSSYIKDCQLEGADWYHPWMPFRAGTRDFPFGYTPLMLAAFDSINKTNGTLVFSHPSVKPGRLGKWLIVWENPQLEPAYNRYTKVLTLPQLGIYEASVVARRCTIHVIREGQKPVPYASGIIRYNSDNSITEITGEVPNQIRRTVSSWLKRM